MSESSYQKMLREGMAEQMGEGPIQEPCHSPKPERPRCICSHVEVATQGHREDCPWWQLQCRAHAQWVAKAEAAYKETRDGKQPDSRCSWMKSRGITIRDEKIRCPICETALGDAHVNAPHERWKRRQAFIHNTIEKLGQLAHKEWLAKGWVAIRVEDAECVLAESLKLEWFDE